ncbi:MAG: HPF/RaiA family ribosome-associated protein [Kofleriaceae bacterium]|nr:HPF/RaiA family ribosome-associated protein [Kofleriaceae bacterium]
MQLEVRSRGMEVTTALTDYCSNRIATHLGRFASEVETVTIRIDDLNGPRGGIDKRVQIHVVLRRAPAINVEVAKTEVWTAIDNVTLRVGACVARNLKRRSQLYLRERAL